MRDSEIRYNLTLPATVNKELEATARKLGTSKAEAIRRALVLIKHAVDADKIELTRDGEKQTVLIK